MYVCIYIYIPLPLFLSFSLSHTHKHIQRLTEALFDSKRWARSFEDGLHRAWAAFEQVRFLRN